MFGVILGVLIAIALVVFMIASYWIVFQKAGRPGWAILIPIYNMIVQFQVAKINPWFILLYLLSIIPFIGWIVSIGMSIWLNVKTAQVFGKGAGFAVGLILLPIVFIPILAFGDAKYIADAE